MKRTKPLNYICDKWDYFCGDGNLFIVTLSTFDKAIPCEIIDEWPLISLFIKIL